MPWKKNYINIGGSVVSLVTGFNGQDVNMVLQFANIKALKNKKNSHEKAWQSI